MKHSRQTGGTFLGLIIGIVIGIGVALAVAAYISKVPIPFVSDRLQSGARQDEADAQRQRQLQNPNATFAGATQPATPAASAEGGDTSSVTGTPLPPVASTDPLGDLMRNHSGQDVAIAAPAERPPVVPDDPFEYYVQAGAFRTDTEADAQRARLTMMGWEARVSKVEQAGRVMYRVRVGPFSRRSDAEQIKKSFDQNGIESALVRVQKQQAG